MAALGEMSASVAHEVNNPLSAILLRSQRLDMLARTDTVDAAAVRKTAHDIDRTVDRIRRIVDALRAFARQGDDDPLRPELLAPIVGDTVELCEHRFRQQAIELAVDPIPEGLHGFVPRHPDRPGAAEPAEQRLRRRREPGRALGPHRR